MSLGAFLSKLFSSVTQQKPTVPVNTTPPIITPSFPDNARPQLFTLQQLKSIFPSTPEENLKIYHGPMLEWLPLDEITTKRRVCHFLAQVGHETGEFRNKVTEENLFYTTPSRLPEVFGSSIFQGKNLNEYVRNPEKLANLVYANKGGNGSSSTGDGWKYRGRGIIQLTLRDNYQAFKNWSGVDVISNPDLLLEPKYAVLSAVWYWKTNNLNSFADRNDIDTLTHRINRAKKGLEHRKQLLARAENIIL